jgi:polyhydroxyalkanoate synthesis regulator phasin
MESAEKNRKQLDEAISKQVEKVVAGLKLATQDDISRLEKKLDEALTCKA